MEIVVNYTYYGHQFAVYTHIKSLCHTPETHIMLFISYTSIWGIPSVSAVKNPPAMQEPQETVVLIPGLRGCPRGGNAHQLHYSYRENPMDRGAWQATVHRVTGTEKPGGLQSMGSQGQKSLASCSPWGHKESDTIEGT